MVTSVNKLLFIDGKEYKNISVWDETPELWTWYSGRPQAVELLARVVQPWVGRAEELTCEAVADMPFTIYRGETEIDSSDDYQNAIEILPNIHDFLKLTASSWFCYGQAYWLKNANRANYVKELKYFVSTTITPELDNKTGLKSFKRHVDAIEIEYKPEQLLYFWPPDSAVEVGPPTTWPLKRMLAAAGVLMNVDTFAATFFERGAIKATLLAVKGNPVPQERERLKSWWKKFTSGVKNAFSAEVINADQVTATQIGEGLEGLTDTNLTREKKEDIAAAAGIPLSVLFSDAANYATSVTDMRSWYENTIVPFCNFIAYTLNEQLLKPLGYRLIFNPNSLEFYQEDENARATSLGALVNAGVPLLMAMDILGYDITDEQRAELEKAVVDKEQRAEQVREQMQGSDNPNPLEQAQNRREAQRERQQELENETPGEKWLDDLAKWKRKSLKALNAGKSPCVEFISDTIPPDTCEAIRQALAECKTREDIERAFDLKAEQPIEVDWQPLLVELKRANDLLEATRG